MDVQELLLLGSRLLNHIAKIEGENEKLKNELEKEKEKDTLKVHLICQNCQQCIWCRSVINDCFNQLCNATD